MSTLCCVKCQSAEKDHTWWKKNYSSIYNNIVKINDDRQVIYKDTDFLWRMKESQTLTKHRDPILKIKRFGFVIFKNYNKVLLKGINELNDQLIYRCIDISDYTYSFILPTYSSVFIIGTYFIYGSYNVKVKCRCRV